MKRKWNSALAVCYAFGALFIFSECAQAQAQREPLPSWNNGPTKQAILRFVQDTTNPAGPHFVDPAARIATFDQDGTTWVEQPLYSQLMFAFARVADMGSKDPKLRQ